MLFWLPHLIFMKCFAFLKKKVSAEAFDESNRFRYQSSMMCR